jgi:hypothetical protein
MDLTVKIIYVDNGLIMTTTYANSKWITDAAYIDGLLTSCDTKSAVQLAACSNATRLNLCNGVIDTTNAGSCVSPIVKIDDGSSTSLTYTPAPLNKRQAGPVIMYCLSKMVSTFVLVKT